MTTILAVSGSLRQASFNTALLRAAKDLVPEGVTLELASIAGIPVYDGDSETAQGLPPMVSALKERIVATDALLLATPEYNQSIPGSLKNAIDWLSRPAADIGRVFGNRPVGLIGASAGPSGTRVAQTAWLAVLRALSTRPFFGKLLYVPNAGQVFDAEGKLVDAKIEKLLTEYLAAFARFAATPA